MPKKTKETSGEQRELIVKLVNSGKSMKGVAKLIGCGKTTVFDIIKKHKQTGSVQNCPRIGRPSKITPRNRARIVRYGKESRFYSAEAIQIRLEDTVGLKIHPRSVNRVLQKGGFVSRVPRKIPVISMKNKKKRLEYAKKYIDEPLSFWNKVLWRDESKFNLKKTDGRVRVWRKPGETLPAQTSIRTFKHGGGSVMVWGCMSAACTGSLVFIDGIMTKGSYLKILKQNVERSARKLWIAEDIIFQQDIDPKHTARIVQCYIHLRAQI